MKEFIGKEKGWKPIPLSLKILAGVFIFWSVMTLFTIKIAYDIGYPLLGIMFNGVIGLIIAFLLVFLAPLIFVYALWNRFGWGLIFALSYIGFFIINNIIALILLQKQIGLIQILFPLIANIIFFIVIYRKRGYFKKR